MLIAAIAALFGVASWFYPEPPGMYAGMNVCAMNTTPDGKSVERELDLRRHITIKIVDLDTHRTSVCHVIGTGPFVAGRILDVSPLVAMQLKMFGAGVANVRIVRLP